MAWDIYSKLLEQNFYLYSPLACNDKIYTKNASKLCDVRFSGNCVLVILFYAGFFTLHTVNIIRAAGYLESSVWQGKKAKEHG
jgi:hypothetical protein